MCSRSEHAYRRRMLDHMIVLHDAPIYLRGDSDTTK